MQNARLIVKRMMPWAKTFPELVEQTLELLAEMPEQNATERAERLHRIIYRTTSWAHQHYVEGDVKNTSCIADALVCTILAKPDHALSSVISFLVLSKPHAALHQAAVIALCDAPALLPQHSEGRIFREAGEVLCHVLLMQNIGLLFDDVGRGKLVNAVSAFVKNAPPPILRDILGSMKNKVLGRGCPGSDKVVEMFFDKHYHSLPFEERVRMTHAYFKAQESENVVCV